MLMLLVLLLMLVLSFMLCFVDVGAVEAFVVDTLVYYILVFLAIC